MFTKDRLMLKHLTECILLKLEAFFWIIISILNVASVIKFRIGVEGTGYRVDVVIVVMQAMDLLIYRNMFGRM
jgi:hypothetical protein